MKGVMLSFFKKAASEFPTNFPFSQTLTSLRISICPLLILVVILSAWKNPI